MRARKFSQRFVLVYVSFFVLFNILFLFELPFFVLNFDCVFVAFCVGVLFCR